MALRGISGVILGGIMTKIIIDVVLFSSMFTFVTGIVLAAHMFWGNGARV
jgi:hypothetical protein